MAALDMHKSPRCQHVHYSGHACKAPARRGRNYCVFHQAAHLDPGACVLPIVEDLHSYQLAIIRIMQSLAADAIDSKKATALLYALQLLGGKLNDFAKQREDVEDPRRSLHNEINERYQARRYPLPNLPEEYLIPILKEMRAEQSAQDRAADTDDGPEVKPDLDAQKSEIENQNSPALHAACHPEGDPDLKRSVGSGEPEGPMHFPPKSIDPSSDLRPPKDDKLNGGHRRLVTDLRGRAQPNEHPAPQSVDSLLQSRPPQNDIGNESHAAGAA